MNKKSSPLLLSTFAYPLTKVIGQGAQAAIELSYEHFPKATEKTLDLIAKVGTQVGNGLDVTVAS
jgi:hypothetical protein